MKAASYHRPFAKRSSFRLPFRYVLSAVTIVLLVYFGVQFSRFYQLSPDNLYKELYRPYPLLQSPIGKYQQASRIEDFYGKSSYDSVIRTAKLQVLLSDKEALLTGIAYLETADAFWAIAPLKKLAASGSSPFHDVGEYYLALAYLKNSDYDDALTVIQQIRNQANHQYRGTFSEELMDEVKMLKWR